MSYSNDCCDQNVFYLFRELDFYFPGRLPVRYPRTPAQPRGRKSVGEKIMPHSSHSQAERGRKNAREHHPLWSSSPTHCHATRSSLSFLRRLGTFQDVCGGGVEKSYLLTGRRRAISSKNPKGKCCCSLWSLVMGYDSWPRHFLPDSRCDAPPSDGFIP